MNFGPRFPWNRPSHCRQEFGIRDTWIVCGGRLYTTPVKGLLRRQEEHQGIDDNMVGSLSCFRFERFLSSFGVCDWDGWMLLGVAVVGGCGWKMG